MNAFIVKGARLEEVRDFAKKSSKKRPNAIITGMNNVRYPTNKDGTNKDVASTSATNGKVVKSTAAKVVQTSSILVICEDHSWLTDSDNGWKISHYVLKENFFPKDGESWKVHVSGFPNTWTLGEVRKFLEGLLSRVFKYKWSSFFPVNEETGKVKGFGTIFPKDESIDTKDLHDMMAYIKLALQNKGVGGTHFLNARWSHAPISTGRKVSTGTRVSGKKFTSLGESTTVTVNPMSTASVDQSTTVTGEPSVNQNEENERNEETVESSPMMVVVGLDFPSVTVTESKCVAAN